MEKANTRFEVAPETKMETLLRLLKQEKYYVVYDKQAFSFRIWKDHDAYENSQDTIFECDRGDFTAEDFVQYVLTNASLDGDNLLNPERALVYDFDHNSKVDWQEIDDDIGYVTQEIEKMKPIASALGKTDIEVLMTLIAHYNGLKKRYFDGERSEELYKSMIEIHKKYGYE